MSKQYRSCLAEEMSAYLRLVENAGQSSTQYRTTFNSLDAYLVSSGEEGKALSELVVSAWMKTLTCGQKSKWNYSCCIRKFSRYLAALEIPAYEPELFRTKSNYVAYTFSDEEFAAIVEAADNFAAMRSAENETSYVFPMLLRILYGCGLRLGEALSLRFSDIEFDAGVIVIRKAKNKKQRIVPVSGSLASVLRLYCIRVFEENPYASLLFESHRKKGCRYLNNTFRMWFMHILEAAGIPNVRSVPSERVISPHTLRHYFTFKSFLKSEAEGRTLDESGPRLAAYLGHESLYGTEKYITTNYVLYKDSHARVEEGIGFLFPEVDFE